MSKEKALDSLELAKSYLDELGEKLDLLESGDKSLIEEFARSLDLALEQIQLTEQNDPTVSWENYDLNDAKWDYNFLKGDLEFFKGNYNGAISYLEQALKIIPHSLASSHIHAILSSCYWNIGNKKDAIENIKRAIELDPENKELRIEYKKELNRMISASEAISSFPLAEENDKKKSAKKSIYISIVWAVLGSICAFICLKSEPRESPLLIFGSAYVFWATYWGWKVLHGLTKKVISGITSTGCIIIIPAMQWIMIGIYYIGIMIPAAAIFGSIGGGIVTFLVHLKRARMSSKTLAISFASLLIFSSILVLLTFNSRRGQIDFERPAYYKEKQPSISEAKIQESKPLPLHREPVESITEQKIIVTPSISLLSLDEAKQRIPPILKRIYQDLDQGNPRASSSFISSNMFSSSQVLDTVCKPFTYRAHYIENIIERPNNKFEVMTRLLSQLMNEIARVLTFRVENNSFVLESVSKYPVGWFDTWKEESKEIARNFYYAMKADKQEVIKKLVSSGEAIYPKFSSHFGRAAIPSYIRFQRNLQSLGEITSISVNIISDKGLKAHVMFSCVSSSIPPTWNLYIDNIDGEYKIIKWQFEEWGWEARATDPNIESYTLKRFKSKEELSSSREEITVSKSETEKRTEEKIEVLNEKMRQELEAKNKELSEIERNKKSEEEQTIKAEEERKEKKPVRAIGEIKPPKLIKKVEPVYPAIAMEARVEGVVILEVTTDIYGKVKNIKVLRSIPLLDQAAIDAVKQWEYEPLFIDSKPRGVIFTATVFFKLHNRH